MVGGGGSSSAAAATRASAWNKTFTVGPDMAVAVWLIAGELSYLILLAEDMIESS